MDCISGNSSEECTLDTSGSESDSMDDTSGSESDSIDDTSDSETESYSDDGIFVSKNILFCFVIMFIW